MESLKAGIQNGADAIYLGGSSFGARASATNFDNDELIEAVKYAKLRNVNIFVTVNTSIKETEVEELISYTDFLYKIGVDAIILSDIGVAEVLRKRYPNMELHASTQISAHSLNDVLELKKVGFNRVVLARELSIEEIKEICDNVDIDIEVFIHGAICISYSGQCLMSSMLGDRSGNRGRCAQPCRQSYKLINKTTGKIIDVNGNYLLSPKDLCSIENIEKILDTGVKSLKIEGRMKRPEYVAVVTSRYRKTIDNYINNKITDDKKALKEDLEAIFNRKFTSGYLMSKNGSDIINLDKPNNVGVKVGEVLSFNSKKNKLKIKLSGKLSKGDGINLGGGSIGRIIKNGEIFDFGVAGEIIEIDFVKNIKSKTPVYKTSDKLLVDNANKSFIEGIENKKINLKCEIFIKVGEKAKFILENIEVYSDKKIEKTNDKEAEIDKIIEKLCKTGGTPYKFVFDNIFVDKDVFVPVSVLNNLRRKAIEKYEEYKLDFSSKRIIYSYKNFSYLKDKKVFNGKITLKVHKNSQLDKILENPDISEYIREIYTEDFTLLEEYYNKFKTIGINLVYSALGVIRNEEYSILEKYLSKINNEIFNKVQISTWGSKNFFKSKFGTKKFNIDTYFNIYNSYSLRFFEKYFDAEDITISQEINKFEIKSLLNKSKEKNANVDMIIYGHTRAMLTEYCAMGVLTKDCHKDRRCAECARSDYILKDMENREFRLFQDIFCRTEIRNHITLDLRENINEIFELGVDRVRLDFTYEDSDMVYRILKECVEYLKYSKKFNYKNVFKGHYINSVN
ncbi:U32 family peptidase [Parvimonas micra]|uniref:U32 family peptidase n=1 Tax=Parvimonas micra TaxID=33033 RepID=UPI0022B6FE17|nr:U32 family peptidase [Parvimonas micra]WBB33092.1 U32 family peptidase [Parvimonas micra]WBB34593.1 U32 family peptidase [Parvimonas micra]WBB36114.1 U32 family peptidase [Parvimonas micra]